MAKILSVDAFLTAIDYDIIWRRKEISDVRQAIRDASPISRLSLIRALIPLIYAHWEGFVVHVATQYLQYIASRRHNFSDIKDHFRRLSFLKRLDALSQSRASLGAKLDLLGEIDQSFSKRFSTVPIGLVESGSNLNSERAKAICLICDIPSGCLVGHEVFLDVEVLKRRNSIAHGEWATIRFDQIDDVSDGILHIMTCFKNEIENALVEERFRR